MAESAVVVLHRQRLVAEVLAHALALLDVPAKVAADDADVVVRDVAVPLAARGSSGTVALQAPALPVVGDADYVVRTDEDVTVLRARVRSLLSGESPTSSPVVHLTRRERQVLELLAQGMSNEALAHVLGISGHTARTHVGNILRKLGASSRLSAAVVARRAGLLSSGYGVG